MTPTALLYLQYVQYNDELINIKRAYTGRHITITGSINVHYKKTRQHEWGMSLMRTGQIVIIWIGKNYYE